MQIGNKTKMNFRSDASMEFTLTNESTSEEIRFALSYPGEGNIIICEGSQVLAKVVEVYKESSK